MPRPKAVSYAGMRAAWQPDPIKVLFLAESPPKSTDHRFFYNAGNESYDNFFRDMMKAVFPDYVHHPGQKSTWLRRFKGEGYYLLDATDIPVNLTSKDPTEIKKLEKARAAHIRAAVPERIKEIDRLILKGTPIILIKRNIFVAFSKVLRAAGYNVVHDRVIPFPGGSDKNVQRFKAECWEALQRVRRGSNDKPED